MAKSNTVRILIVVLAIAVVVVALVAFNWPAAPAVAPAASAPARVESATETATKAEAETGSQADAPANAAGLKAVSNAPAAAEAAAALGPITFAIDPTASEARFRIDEVLLGVPTEVVGATNFVSGTLTVDPSDPGQSQLGTISIDARELRTDRELRNRSIRRFILEAGRDEYQYITFTPTAVEGLPAQAAPGDELTFQITGDLKIKDVTQPVTFDVELLADSATQISGAANATINRADFGLEIPSAPGVAGVSEEVQLELVFTAVAQ